ncbi:hypothetical protein BG454_08005 [Roseinatronobacter bogoriensis subsp. barguzinensis]|uniref:Uncharacterized protein n=1 Tax=Roseinatronobacter bogoriensis subsp. barguzinensis TaxID=441209 RepID=A0A2K8K9Y7_9RHOB|nr:hypothetical protein BG454_08005 [Rhodobaca barguzinensis]
MTRARAVQPAPFAFQGTTTQIGTAVSYRKGQGRIRRAKCRNRGCVGPAVQIYRMLERHKAAGNET